VFLNLVIQNFTYLLEDSDVAQTLIHLFARHAPSFTLRVFAAAVPSGLLIKSRCS
jgi:hypothetical protein